MASNQTDVAEEEVDSLLRHLWHAELDFFDNENPFEHDIKGEPPEL